MKTTIRPRVLIHLLGTAKLAAVSFLVLFFFDLISGRLIPYAAAEDRLLVVLFGVAICGAITLGLSGGWREHNARLVGDARLILRLAAKKRGRRSPR